MEVLLGHLLTLARSRTAYRPILAVADYSRHFPLPAENWLCPSAWPLYMSGSLR